MNFFEMIGNLTIGPLRLVFEFIFSIAYKFSNNIGISIALLSLAVNILVLPLYMRADALQEEERKKQESIAEGIKHIKKVFKGDERMMMLQTYYRQNDYNPIYVLKSSVSLLLQIPFFIAAYTFLSNLILLKGASFGPISNLGTEDALFHIGSFSINVLPVAMTVINIVSGMIFTKGKPIKTKIQLYGMALAFLVLLYKSPSGLVFYWTLNNVFSLGKNIVQRFIEEERDKKKTAVIKKSSVDGRSNSVNDNSNAINEGINKSAAKNAKDAKENAKTDIALFIMAGVFLSIFVGAYIPLIVIQSSVAEFSNPHLMKDPNHYVLPTILYSFGFFVVWPFVFFAMTSSKKKKYFAAGFVSLLFVFIVDFMAFQVKNNALNTALQYAVYESYSTAKILLNLLATVLIIPAVFFIYKKKKVIFTVLIPAFIVAISAMSVSNSVKITKEFKGLYYVQDDLLEGAEIKLSKEGKNVIVLMLDRALGVEAPYIFNELPELKEAYDGFTLYTNTVSYGCGTNIGAPALFGGYEYTPERINARETELLSDKHDEALKVLPVLFDNEGYDVTVCDPPYAGYQWYPDLSIYDEYPDINSFNLEFKYNPDVKKNALYTDEIRYRNFFCYSIMSASPVILRPVLYDKGFYNKEVAYYENGTLDGVQALDDIYHAHGKKVEFMDWYYAFENLSDITVMSENKDGAFVMMCNCITHEPMMLQMPDYTIDTNVDNSAYEFNPSTYTMDGKVLRMENVNQVSHYHTNVLALKEVAKWINTLKEMGVYDNTRIIIVSDHGRNLNHYDLVDEKGNDFEFFLPLLLVKDFDAKGFEMSDEFMTNADVASVAVNGVVKDPVNPFSGNRLDGHERNGEQRLLYSLLNDTGGNGEYVFLPGEWYTVDKDAHDLKNWKYLGNW